jgi:hypothetical protein
MKIIPYVNIISVCYFRFESQEIAKGRDSGGTWAAGDEKVSTTHEFEEKITYINIFNIIQQRNSVIDCLNKLNC